MDSELAPRLAAIESSLGDPREGLPEGVFLFVSRITPLINVDLLIQDDRSRTLLTWRDDEFHGSGWHVPGGIIRYKESWADRLRACAREELAADVACDATPLFVAESIRPQATRGHFVSLLFRCRLLTPPDPAREAGADRPAPGQWRWHNGRPPDLLEAQRHYARFF